MINDKLIDIFLQCAEKKDLIRGIKEVFNHFRIDSDRYEEIVNNIIDIIGDDKLITIEDIDINLIKDDIEAVTYKSEEVDKDSIEISDIDNVDKTVNFIYKRKGSDYKHNYRLNYTNYLKKVKEN